MAISECGTQVDSLGRELVIHGDACFPIGCYHDDLRKEDVPWHWHEELEAAVVTRGETLLRVEKDQVQLREGDAFFINSGYLHACDYTGSGPCRFHSMVFHARLIGGEGGSVYWKKYLEPMMDRADLKYRVFRQDVPEEKKQADRLEAAWLACASEKTGYEFEVRYLLSKFLLGLGEGPMLSAGSRHSSERTDYRIKEMLRFIEAHYAERITAEDIAGSAGISTSECLRVFHKTLGTTPVKHLNELRIRKAAHLLACSDLKIIDIGLECGFQDMSYFSRAFAKEKGTTPREYRQFARFRQPEEPAT